MTTKPDDEKIEEEIRFKVLRLCKWDLANDNDVFRQPFFFEGDAKKVEQLFEGLLTQAEERGAQKAFEELSKMMGTYGRNETIDYIHDRAKNNG